MTNTGIERMRGGFAKVIFQDTLKQLYDKQTDARDALREQAGSLLKDLTYRIDAGDCADEQLETILTQLRDRLQAVPGKRIYQYLPPDAKRLVNMAVERLAENDPIAALYKIWQERVKRFWKLIPTQNENLSLCPAERNSVPFRTWSYVRRFPCPLTHRWKSPNLVGTRVPDGQMSGTTPICRRQTVRVNRLWKRTSWP